MKLNTSRLSGYSSEMVILITGVILIILAGIFYVVDPISIVKEQRDIQRYGDLMHVREGLNKYYEDYGSYPENSENYTIIDAQYGEINWGENWEPYVDVVPEDPQGERRYVYYSNPNLENQTYVLYASFELPWEFDITCFSDGGACGGVPEGASCGQACNAGVASPNVSP